MKTSKYIVYKFHDGSAAVYKLINEFYAKDEIQVSFCDKNTEYEYVTELDRWGDYIKFDTYDQAIKTLNAYNYYAKQWKEAKATMDGIISGDKKVLRKLKLQEIEKKKQ